MMIQKLLANGRVRQWGGVLILSLCFGSTSPGQLSGQTPAEFRPLFDGQSLNGWVVENSEAGNFSVREGVLRVEGPGGWLRSEQQYADFVLSLEFRLLTDDSDSGVFVRAASVAGFGRGWPANSYQIQVRDVTTNRTSSPILIGDIYRHRMPPGETSFDPAAALAVARPVGEWQEFEIELIGDSLVVRLNGTLVTRASNVLNPAGYVGLQGEAGTVEFRSIRIREHRAL
jgi:hypothetical protein